MADMNSDSTSSGENSGNSNSSDKSKGSKKSRTLRTQNWTSKSMTAHDGDVVGNRKASFDDLMDRQSASKAVAIVVHTASKRGYVPLCTEFASLIRENKRMELEINRLRFLINQMRKKCGLSSESNQCYSSSSASESGSGGSQGLKIKKTQTKISTAINPRQDVQNAQDQNNVQTPLEEGNKEIPEQTPDSKQNIYEELKRAKDHILKLESQVTKLTAENQALKSQVQLSELCSDHLKNIENKTNRTTRNRISPERIPTPPSLAKETINTSIDNLKHDENCCMKSCVKHRRKHGSRPLPAHKITPAKLEHVIEDSTSTLGNTLMPLIHKGHQTNDKNQLKPKVLPKLGDYVTVQGEIKGYVNYIGPVKGETSSFVGIHLPSPVGNNDGSVDGVKYFSCPQNYGAFVPLQDIKNVDPRPSKPFQS